MKFLLVLCALSITALAIDPVEGTGLEVPPNTKLRVLVTVAQSSESKLNLKEEQVEARVSALLKKAGIPSVDHFGTSDATLCVQITFAETGFSIETQFRRRVYYASAGRSFTILGTTWNKGLTGFADSEEGALDGVNAPVETFCAEFLKANAKGLK